LPKERKWAAPAAGTVAEGGRLEVRKLERRAWSGVEGKKGLLVSNARALISWERRAVVLAGSTTLQILTTTKLQLLIRSGCEYRRNSRNNAEY
jgi:hypothetical protein